MNPVRFLALACFIVHVVSTAAAAATQPDLTPRITRAYPLRNPPEGAVPNTNDLHCQILDGREVQSLIQTNRTATTVRVFTIRNPPISSVRYAITGEVSYTNVQGTAYLELWNCFAAANPGTPGPRFFSRTLGAYGPLGRIQGSSRWRAFELPFDTTGAPGAPELLEMNLVMPGPGTVHVASLKLVEYAGDWPWSPLQSGAGSAWWGPREAGYIGGIVGIVFGVTAGLLGWMAGRGRARGLVMAGMRGLIALGVVCLMASCAALFQNQPRDVWFPLLVIGGLGSTVFVYGYQQMLRQYEARELQRIRAADALGG